MAKKKAKKKQSVTLKQTFLSSEVLRILEHAVAHSRVTGQADKAAVLKTLRAMKD